VIGVGARLASLIPIASRRFSDREESSTDLASSWRAHEQNRLENRLVQGKVHEVMVVSGGFLWQEETYSSLSTIALRITGTSWSVRRFFGLQDGADPGPPSPSLHLSIA
jgi:hypothetical protein